ncbi:glycosyltransferase family 4 protein [Paracraurococcus lichenis]|uniref:Glycosyltransferase family 4 protein n=1 Tax=Paracraurococcus lichenis TaxID=3064888 RepID=A0ABT9E4G3_9PROT|nr:glycosyltransferase family 4 protein [Paracraurococcus sp. LOR1-02]MDO9711066.1 glycosyltransferase family 4 protein [Paracraurococcus sp. LOR1-02]
MKPPDHRLARALVLLPSTELGGAEKHTAILARDLAARGAEVTIALEPALQPGFAGLLGPGSAVRFRPGPFAWRPKAAVEANLAAQEEAVIGLVATARPDLVILPLPWPTHGLGLMRGLLALGRGALVIHHLAPHDPEPPLPAAARAVIAALPAAPFHWVAVSAPVAARSAALLGLAEAAFTVIPNGVPVPREDPGLRAALRLRQRRRLGLAPAARLVVFAGRLELSKGADLLPEIAERLEAMAGATLAALGEGSLRPKLEASRAGRRLGPLRLPGHVEDVPDWLLAADALLLPSRNEGCPFVFLEAAARRCPVIASGDALECYGSDASSLAAVAPTGGVSDLTGKAAMRLNDPAAARAAVDAAFRFVFDQDEAAMLRRYASFMRTILA